MTKAAYIATAWARLRLSRGQKCVGRATALLDSLSRQSGTWDDGIHTLPYGLMPYGIPYGPIIGSWVKCSCKTLLSRVLEKPNGRAPAATPVQGLLDGLFQRPSQAATHGSWTSVYRVLSRLLARTLTLARALCTAPVCGLWRPLVRSEGELLVCFPRTGPGLGVPCKALSPLHGPTDPEEASGPFQDPFRTAPRKVPRKACGPSHGPWEPLL
jgi:hypothetical protein